MFLKHQKTQGLLIDRYQDAYTLVAKTQADEVKLAWDFNFKNTIITKKKKKKKKKSRQCHFSFSLSMIKS